MNIKEYISDLDISNGDTKRTNCPVCGGIKTFTATNNMGQLMWNCYKAGCKVSGGSRVRLTTDDIRSSLGSAAQETEAVPSTHYISIIAATRVGSRIGINAFRMKFANLLHHDLSLIHI